MGGVYGTGRFPGNSIILKGKQRRNLPATWAHTPKMVEGMKQRAPLVENSGLKKGVFPTAPLEIVYLFAGSTKTANVLRN